MTQTPPPPETTERSPTRIQTANRETILSAALTVFSAHGFRGSTIDQIARRAGMSKPNLLYYFRRKEDIYAAVLERTLALWLAPLEGLDPEGDPIEELRTYILAKLRMSFEHPEASRLFANEILSGAAVISPVLETGLRDLVRQKSATIETWIAQGRLAPIDPPHLIFMIWATTQHYADFAVQIRAVIGDRVSSPDFPSEAANAILALIVGGLKPHPGHSDLPAMKDAGPAFPPGL